MNRIKVFNNYDRVCYVPIKNILSWGEYKIEARYSDQVDTFAVIYASLGDSKITIYTQITANRIDELIQEASND